MAPSTPIELPSIRSQAPAELAFALADLELVGFSVSALATAFAVDAFKVAIDMGRCSPVLAGQDTVLLTHCHSDHVAGLVAWLSARSRHDGLQRSRVVVPAERRQQLLEALSAWPDLDRVRRRVDLASLLVGARPGDLAELHGGARARAIPARHSVPCLGWQLLAPAEPRPRLVFTGDSGVDAFASDPALLDAQAVIVDCSFVEPGTAVAARLSGHGHLQEWLDLLPSLACDVLILSHLPSDASAERLVELVSETTGQHPRLVAWLGGFSLP